LMIQNARLVNNELVHTRLYDLYHGGYSNGICNYKTK
jgi:hypothetical protein